VALIDLVASASLQGDLEPSNHFPPVTCYTRGIRSTDRQPPLFRGPEIGAGPIRPRRLRASIVQTYREETRDAT
jgi:hypothetical protein